MTVNHILLSWQGRVQLDHDADFPDDVGDAADAHAKRARAKRPSSLDVLPAACVFAALDGPTTRRLLGKGPVAAVFEVPGPDWVEPARRPLGVRPPRQARRWRPRGGPAESNETATVVGIARAMAKMCGGT